MRRIGSVLGGSGGAARHRAGGVPAAVLAVALAFAPAATAATTDVSLVYGISVGGVRIGEVEVNARFDENGYAVSLSGETRGISRFVSNASATMSARGSIRNGRVLPAEFQLSMTEGPDGADATMTVRDRNVMDLTVVPGLVPWFDLVPLTMDHVRNIVDPMSAMIAPVRRIEGLTAFEACNRTIPVFDGWSRYDVTLGGGEVRTVIGGAGGYSGLVYVCHASYRPIAGHRSSEVPVVYMEGNSRLQATLMPIAGQFVLVPFELLIGTEIGDLVIRVETVTYAPAP
ncbi:MAG: DUF3108 domain-containing protein [Bauldia sp.]